MLRRRQLTRVLFAQRKGQIAPWPRLSREKWKWPDSDHFRPRSRKVGLLSKCKAQKAAEGHAFLDDQPCQQLQRPPRPLPSPPLLYSRIL